MESTNLPRTYTAQTCNLVITNQAGLLPQAQLDSAPLRERGNRTNLGEFTLKIDRSEHSNADPIVLNGQLDQLDKLQQTVSEYVAQLGTEVPIATEDRQQIQPEVEDTFVESVVASQLYPASGIVKNLPGLRSRSSQLTIETVPSKESHPFSAASISKLLNRSKENSTLIAPDKPISAPPAPTPTFGSTKLPRVTQGDLPLEYKLYLSDNNSGRVLTLSRMQLVDLATALDEYANDTVAVSSSVTQIGEFVETADDIPEIQPAKIETAKIYTPEIQPAKIETAKVYTPEIEPAKIETAKVYTPEIEPAKIETAKIPQSGRYANEQDEKLPSVATVSALSRLPNLPSIPSKINSNRSYDYDDDSQPAFMSALPWLAAAAMVVGVPLLVFGANPSFLKESMAKVKMPTDPQQLLGGKKEDAPASVNPAQPATNPTSGDEVAAAGANLPKPWESQPVTPPTNPASIGSPIPQPSGANGISIAPLPPSIANIPEGTQPQDAPTATGDSGAAMASVPPQQQNKTASGIAPNPLGGSSIPQGFDNPKPQQQSPVTTATANIPVSPLVTQPKSTKPPTATQPKATKVPTTVASKSKATKLPTTVASKSKGIISITGSVVGVASPVENRSSKATKIRSVSPKQNSQISVSSQPMLLPPDISGMGNEPPLTPPPFPAAKAIETAPLAPIKQYKKVVKAKAKPIVIAKKSVVTPIANTVAKKAVRVIPLQTSEPTSAPGFTNPSAAETAPLVVPPIVSEPQFQSNNNRTPDLLDNPSLNETKRYFQSKWRADVNQSSPLQYVVQFDPKSGVVQSVDPQGEASTTYLKKTGVIKTGQKLVSPIASGEGEQKIRVLLQPDGNVETFIEP